MSTIRGKPFQKGHDSRRHTFTKEECERGFWAAIESVAKRYPNATLGDHRHIACRLLSWANGKTGKRKEVAPP